MGSKNAAAGPMRLHHAARVVRDQESNRKLVEEVLGIPLAATWCENVPNPEKSDSHLALCHTFYRLADGSSLAFFQFGDPADHERYAPKVATLTGMFDHTALKVDKAGYDDLVKRVKAAGAKYLELDHGYCRSLYVPSDEGYMLEFTCDPAEVDTIDAEKAVTAHEDLRRWLGGDHRSNNNVRHG